jgi:hypothetical protein
MKTIITATFRILLVNLIFLSTSHSQDVTKIKSNNQKQNEIILQKSDLELNGINSALLNIEVSNNDIIKLRNFDFSNYRNYYNIQEVQIENGPKIILYSIEAMISKGQKFDDQLISNKKNVDDTNIMHPIIPTVNIGFGKNFAPELH